MDIFSYLSVGRTLPGGARREGDEAESERVRESVGGGAEGGLHAAHDCTDRRLPLCDQTIGS